jgi:hypothetical protein
MSYSYPDFFLWLGGARFWAPDIYGETGTYILDAYGEEKPIIFSNLKSNGHGYIIEKDQTGKWKMYAAPEDWENMRSLTPEEIKACGTWKPTELDHE